MSKKPFRILVTSNKGGTGRSTTTLGLAWALGQLGLNCVLEDRNPIPSLALIAADAQGRCPWPGVSLEPANDRSDFHFIDSQALDEPETRDLLGTIDGVILNCQAEVLSLSILEAALETLINRRDSGKPALLGLCLQRFDAASSMQSALRDRLERMSPELILAVIPHDPALGKWAMESGAALPVGPARDRFMDCARALVERIGIHAPGIQQVATNQQVRVSRREVLAQLSRDDASKRPAPSPQTSDELVLAAASAPSLPEPLSETTELPAPSRRESTTSKVSAIGLETINVDYEYSPRPARPASAPVTVITAARSASEPERPGLFRKISQLLFRRRDLS